MSFSFFCNASVISILMFGKLVPTGTERRQRDKGRSMQPSAIYRGYILPLETGIEVKQ